MAARTKRRAPKPTTVAKVQTGPAVYSYGRFSHPDQAKGDSFRRQTSRWNDAQEYAKRKGLPFNQSLRMFDRGKSAYHGHHLTKGVFGSFLASIKSGEVARGSVLVIEEIDRISRLEMVPGLLLVLDIIKNGVTIYTPGDNAEYSAESLNTGQVYVLIGKLQAAHDTSKKTSDRLSRAWEAKRKSATDASRLLTHVVPAWIEVANDGSRSVVRNADKAMTLMFQLKEAGLSVRLIVERLNKARLWSPSSGWRTSYIRKCLCDRRVLGEYQPCRKVNGKRIPVGMAIPGYFPPVVEPGMFHRVQRILTQARATAKGGRADKVSNVLQHLCRCAYCSGPMHWKNNGEGLQYLFCAEKRCCSMRYDEVETTVIEQCRRLKPEQVLPPQDRQKSLVNESKQKLNGLLATKSDIEQQIENFVSQIGRTSDPKLRDAYEARILQLRSQLSDVEAEMVAAQNELQTAEQDRLGFESWQVDIATLQKAMVGNVEVRQRLNAHLREVIEKIEVFGAGNPVGYDWPDFSDYFAAIQSENGSAQPQLTKAFVAWVLQRQMTKAGRFLRVHFRMSDARRAELATLWGRPAGFVDVAPDGSISGQPDIEALLGQFARAKTRGLC